VDGYERVDVLGYVGRVWKWKIWQLTSMRERYVQGGRGTAARASLFERRSHGRPSQSVQSPVSLARGSSMAIGRQDGADQHAQCFWLSAGVALANFALVVVDDCYCPVMMNETGARCSAEHLEWIAW